MKSPGSVHTDFSPHARTPEKMPRRCCNPRTWPMLWPCSSRSPQNRSPARFCCAQRRSHSGSSPLSVISSQLRRFSTDGPALRADSFGLWALDFGLRTSFSGDTGSPRLRRTSPESKSLSSRRIPFPICLGRRDTAGPGNLGRAPSRRSAASTPPHTLGLPSRIRPSPRRAFPRRRSPPRRTRVPRPSTRP